MGVGFVVRVTVVVIAVTAALVVAAARIAIGIVLSLRRWSLLGLCFPKWKGG